MLNQAELECVAAEIPVWERANSQWLKREQARVLRNNLKRLNKGLYELGRTYHDSVPLDTVNELLSTYLFTELEPMILCGRDGSIHENVGYNQWLSLTWHKMESGRWEVVAYVS